MATDVLLQYIAVAIIIIIATAVAIRYIYQSVKSSDDSCRGCALSGCCNKKNTLAKHNCNDKKNKIPEI